MRLHHATWYLAALVAASAPSLARAQGFGLNEIGTCAVARSAANTSAPCRDASMVYWNPAAISRTSGHSVLVGAAAIALDGDFTQDTTGRVWEGDVPVEVPPHLFWSYQAPASGLGYGVGVYVPYGLTSQWTDSFPGRFSALKAALQSIYLQPTVSWRIDTTWSVAVAPIVAHSSLELRQALDLSSVVAVPATATTPAITFGQLGIARGTEFGRLRGTADDWGFGFTAAVKGRLTPTWEAGVRFLSEVKFDYTGDARFTQTQTGLVLAGPIPPTIPAGTQMDTLLAKQFASDGALVSQGIETSITHPAQVQAGVTYTGFPSTSVSVEYHWVGWKAFKDLPIDFTGAAASSSRVLIEDYNNTSAIRVGVDHRIVQPGFANGWSVRAGSSAATAAAPPESVTPLLPDQDRYTLSFGTGIPLTSTMALDLGYMNVGVWGARGRIVERSSRTQTAAQLNTGSYRLRAHIFSLSLKADF